MISFALLKDRVFKPWSLVPSTNLYRQPASRSGRSLLYMDGIPRVVNITETSPYSFGNFRKLSLYTFLCPFNLLIRFKCYNTV